MICIIHSKDTPIQAYTIKIPEFRIIYKLYLPIWAFQIRLRIFIAIFKGEDWKPVPPANLVILLLIELVEHLWLYSVFLHQKKWQEMQISINTYMMDVVFESFVYDYYVSYDFVVVLNNCSHPRVLTVEIKIVFM